MAQQEEKMSRLQNVMPAPAIRRSSGLDRSCLCAITHFRQSGPCCVAIPAALLLLDRMGLSPADLMATARARRPAPAFAEYVPGNTRGRGLARGNVR